MSSSNQEISQFKEFVRAQRQIVSTLKGVHRDTASQELTDSEEYLINKLSEGLALIFTKDVNSPASWKSLDSTVTLGSALAQHASMTAMSEGMPGDIPSES